MIVSKPKAGSLFSLGIFSIGGIIVGGLSFRIVLSGVSVPWYHYLASLTLFPLALVLFVRIFWAYKIVKIGKEKIFIRFPFRFQTLSVALKEIKQWKEIRVKSKTGNYREIEVLSNSKKISLNNQEHTKYEEVLNYLEKKARRTKIST
jgi:hypothetical protein